MDGLAADTDPNVAYTWDYGLSGSAATYARLEKITLPGGRQVYYNYEDANAFMSLGRVGDIADGSSTGRTKYVAYKYLGASTVVDANHPAVPTGLRLTLDPNADKAYAGFDGLGRVIDQRWARSNSADPNADRFGYTYDRASNRLTRSQALKSAYNETYHYDGLDRLKDANRPGDSGMGQLDQSWMLRPTGNWSSFISAGVTQTRTHNNANEILTITRDPIDPPDPLYDPAGSNVFGPKPNDDANGMHCRYDAWNRLATIHLDDGDTPGTLNGTNTLLATYRYDGLNRRVLKVTHDDPNTTGQYMFYNENWQIVEVRRGVNQTPTPAAYKQYAWDLRYIDAPVCRWWDDDANSATAAKQHYFTNDGNFNTTALIDANSGAVVERYQYDPYGKVTVLNGASGTEKDSGVSEWSPDADNKSDWDNDVLYCGYRYDAETGLFEVRNRYYDPTTGTWKTRDKSGYGDGMGLYEYVRSRPTDRIDPFGLQASQPASQPASDEIYSIEYGDPFEFIAAGQFGNCDSPLPWWSRLNYMSKPYADDASASTQPATQPTQPDRVAECYVGYAVVDKPLALEKVPIRLPKKLGKARSIVGIVDGIQVHVAYDDGLVDRLLAHEVAHVQAYRYVATQIDKRFLEIALAARTKIKLKPGEAEKAISDMLEPVFQKLDALYRTVEEESDREIDKQKVDFGDESPVPIDWRWITLTPDMGDWVGGADRALRQNVLAPPEPR